MAMGSTGTVNITPEMMKQALDAIEEYQKQAVSLHDQLTETVNGLIPSSFSGSAADGFKVFYDTKIEPVVGEDLTKLLDALRDMCQGILDAIPGGNGIDEQLGTGNRQ